MKDLLLLRSLAGEFYTEHNDINFTQDGDLQVVEGNDRAKQNAVKILLTDKGNNLKYPNYGALLQKIVKCGFNTFEKQQLVKDSILQALTYLNTIEESTSNSEKLYEITSIETKQTSDPREIYVNLDITLKDGATITIILEE